MQNIIELKGVKEIKPANNENSLIVTFWNDAEIHVNSLCQVGVNEINEVILWGQR